MTHWSEFPRHVVAWKEDMLARRLGHSFQHFAREETQYYTTCFVPRQVISCKTSTVTSLHVDFFGMVNDFNLSFSHLLEPNLGTVGDSAEVYTRYRVAGMGIFGQPDIIITDGTDSMTKVGFGEIKTPWVIRPDAIQDFSSDSPSTILAATTLLQKILPSL